MIHAAAIRYEGIIYTLGAPNRHYHIIGYIVDSGMPWPLKGEQGFLDSNLGFLNRTQARARAIECGQVGEIPTQELFTENLW